MLSTLSFSASADQLLDDVSFDVSESEITSLETIGQCFVIEPEQV